MKRLLAAGAAFLCLAAAPQASAQTAGVPLSVRTGDVYTIRIEQTQTSGRGEEHLNATFSQVLALRIVDAENRIWRYTPVSFNFTFPREGTEEAQASPMDWSAISEGMSALVRIATDVGFECHVDEFGACVELSNWPLWRDRAENLVLMIDAFARAAPPPPAIAPEAEASAKNETDENQDEVVPAPAPPPVDWTRLRGPLLAGLARVLDGIDNRDAASMAWSMQPMASYQGRTLTRRQNVDIVEEMELPFGAAPFRFAGTLRLQRIDRANNTAIIARNVTLDSAAARASLESMAQFVTTNVVEPVAAASPSGAEAAPSGEALMGMLRSLLDTVDFRYQETGTGVVDLATGMVRETTTDFVISLAPASGEGEPFEMRGRTSMRVTPGAPEVPRLPRR